MLSKNVKKYLPLFCILMSVFCTSVFSIAAEADPVSFIACPIYRDADAGPKSGCWLATERVTGITYDIGSGLTKPIGNKAVLVEGRTGPLSIEDAKFCGGLVLSSVRISVVEEPCAYHILPAEGYPGRVFRPPGETMKPLTVQRALPEPPFEDKTYSILFNYNSDFLNYQYSEVILEKASLYIKASKAVTVEVVGVSATEPLLVSNRELTEDTVLAKQRAEKTKIALLRLGVEPSLIELKWKEQGAPVQHYNQGLSQETHRRVDINITVTQ